MRHRSYTKYSYLAAGAAIFAGACSEPIAGPRSLAAGDGPSATVVASLPAPPAGASSLAIVSGTSAFTYGGFNNTFAPTFATVFAGGGAAASDLQANLATRNPGWTATLPALGSAHWLGSQSDANEYVMLPGTYRFSTPFSFPAGATPVRLDLTTLSDNLVIVYLNGTEIGRNSPTADCVPGSSTCNWMIPLNITDAASLHTGANTLTVDLINTIIGAPGNTCALGVPTTPIDFRTYALGHGWTVALCQSPSGFDLNGKAYYNPPPTTGCTFTKGWYRNHGEDTVKPVDGRTKAEAQAIFDATPGKPGGVTWQGGNDVLNLYQQLLAAILNGGTGGPAAVQTAIAQAQAGTGGTGLNITTNLTQAQVSALIDTLSDFNEGTFPGWPHC